MITRNYSFATLGLMIILLGVLLQTALYAFFVPAWEAPDEPAHYLYVAYVARYARPPNPSPLHLAEPFYANGYVTSMYEWYHPALGYAWQAIAYRAIQIFDPTLLPAEFPEISPAFARNPFEQAYLFVPSRASPFDLPHSHLGILGVRLFSTLLVLPLIWAVYHTALAMLPNQPGFALATAGMVGFIPQFNFISATIRNDTVNNLMSALCILALTRFLAQPSHQPGRYAFVIGTLLGITCITKANSIFLIPAAGLAFLFAPYTWSERARLAVIASSILSMIVIVYFVRYAEARYALTYSFTQIEIKPGTLTWDYFLSIPAPLRDMFWARFGWANVRVPEAWIGTATFLGLSGIGITLTRWIARWCRNWLVAQEHRQLIFLCAVMILNLLMIWRYNLYAYQPQGRFLFPVLGPLGILALWGIWQIVAPRHRWILGFITIGLMWLFSTSALFLVIIPAYY